MPHVVLTGDASGLDLRQILVPFSEEKDSQRIKINDIYFERKGGCALVSAIVVEEGHPQSFYILVTKNDSVNQLTIRLDPSTDPIKTRGVKRSIAAVAERVLHSANSFAVERHNISGYLDAEFERADSDISAYPE